MGSIAPRRIVLATRNRHKLIELRRMLEPLGVDLVGLDDVAPEVGDLVEDGETFAENARSKARQAAAITGLPALADDSGLEVDALGGAPGVRSARFAGGHGDARANTALLLERLEGVPDAGRTARFRCVIALVDPAIDGEPLFEGACEGRIAHAERGRGGFGYDPVFFLPDRGVTVAELDDREKDAISHRGQAVARLASYLRSTS
jgi:XTP/dITP diphosphohydrolase